MTARDTHGNQYPEDRHDGNYDHDASGWVRGARGEPTGNNEDATGKPMRFDRGNSWRRAGKGNG